MARSKLLGCFRCGNVWRPRHRDVRICPLCKSRLWNTPLLQPIPPFDAETKPWTEIILRNRSAILEVVQRHRADNPRVFGSVRRGTAGPKSDLDLLVTFVSNASLLDQIELKQELEQVLHRRVDVVSDRSLFWLTRAQILTEAEPV